MLLRRRGRSECARGGYAWPRSGQFVRVSPLKAAAACSRLRSSSVIPISILWLFVGLEAIGRAYGIRPDASRCRDWPCRAKRGARYRAGLADRKMAAEPRNMAQQSQLEPCSPTRFRFREEQLVEVVEVDADLRAVELLEGSDYLWAEGERMYATLVDLLECVGWARLAHGVGRVAPQLAEQAIGLDELYEPSWRLALQVAYSLGLRESITRRYDEPPSPVMSNSDLSPPRETRLI